MHNLSNLEDENTNLRESNGNSYYTKKYLFYFFVYKMNLIIRVCAKM